MWRAGQKFMRILKNEHVETQGGTANGARLTEIYVYGAFFFRRNCIRGMSSGRLSCRVVYYLE